MWLPWGVLKHLPKHILSVRGAESLWPASCEQLRTACVLVGHAVIGTHPRQLTSDVEQPHRGKQLTVVCHWLVQPLVDCSLVLAVNPKCCDRDLQCCIRLEVEGLEETRLLGRCGRGIDFHLLILLHRRCEVAVLWCRCATFAVAVASVELLHGLVLVARVNRPSPVQLFAGCA